jgi:iron complex outermembrane receptor protein
MPPKFLTKAIVFALSCSFLPILHSQQDSIRKYEIPSITVTTTRALERKSPVTFSELSQKEIQKLHTNVDLPKILSDLPSVLFFSENGNSIGYSNLTMRGFNQRRISVLINGIPQNDPEDHNVYWINSPDLMASLSKIQVQRGAGLASTGTAAIGGSIALTTNDFLNERFIRYSTGMGVQEYGANDKTIFTNNSMRNSLELSSGLVDNYAFYARISKIQSNGYRDNSWANLNSFFFSAVRFDDNISTQINVFGGPIEDGLAYTGLPKHYMNDLSLRRRNYSDWGYDGDSLNSTNPALSYSVQRRNQEIENFHQPHFEVINDWEINESITLKSSLFYYTGTGFFDFDASWADRSTLRLTSEYGFNDSVLNPANSIVRGYVGNKHGGWLPRLVISHQNGEMTIGTEIRFHRSEHWGKVRYADQLPNGFDPDYKMYEYNGERDIYSAFIREQYEVTKDLLLHSELQLVHHSYRIANERAGGKFVNYTDISNNQVGGNGQLFDVRYTFLNPRIGLHYNINDEQSAFVSINATSREPRMRNLYAASDTYFGGNVPLFEMDTTGGNLKFDFSKPLIKPETLIDFEVGHSFKNQHFHVSTTVFLMEFFNELVKSGRQDIFGAPIDGNAERSRHLGLELSGAATIFSSNTAGTFIVGANATISKNTLVKYSFFTTGNNGENVVLSLDGNQVAGFPEQMGSLFLRYNKDNFSIHTRTKYVGQFTSDNFGSPSKIQEYLQIAPVTDYIDNIVPSYIVSDVELSYTFPSFLSTFQSGMVRFHCNNIFNNLYAASAEGRNFFPAAERNYYIGLQFDL